MSLQLKKRAKRLFIFIDMLILLSVLLIVIAFVSANFKTSIPSYTKLFPVPDVCDSTDTLNHLYHPFRFTVYNHCVTATGIVMKISDEKDGDFKFELKVDPPYQKTLNTGNKLLTHNNLIVEIICVFPSSKKYEQEACTNYTNNIYLPKIGDRIKVTGQHVLDIPHGWNEIHPAYLITNEK